MTIKEAEQLTGIKKANIRYYEEVGLIQPKRDSSNRYRDYGREEIAMLKKIKFLRGLDISISDIKNLQRGTVSLAEMMQRKREELRDEMEQTAAIEKLCARIQEQGVYFESLDVEMLSAPTEILETKGRKAVQLDKINQLKKYDQFWMRLIQTAASIFLLVTVFMKIQMGKPVPWWFTLTVGLVVVTAFCAKFLISRKIEKLNG